MRTTKEVLINNGVFNKSIAPFNEEVQGAMVQYAKEAINEVLKKYWESQNETIRKGGNFKSIDEVALEVMKNL
jgi:hypothetical protein